MTILVRRFHRQATKAGPPGSVVSRAYSGLLAFRRPSQLRVVDSPLSPRVKEDTRRRHGGDS